MHLKNQFLAIGLIVIVLSGCGSEYPTVSGTVTYDGKPISKIEVVFAPQSNTDSALAGPVSSAVTDANGHFSLRTREGDLGAVVGKHAVGFRWCDIHGDSLTALKVAYNETRNSSPQDAKEIAERIELIKEKLKGRPPLPENLETEFELTAAGTTEANFELTEL